MDIKKWIYFKVIGKQGIEAFYLDSFLQIVADNPFVNSPDFKGSKALTQERIQKKLIKDGFIEGHESISKCKFTITSDGKLHLEQGGYKRKLFQEKLNRLSFWFSLFAAILSIISIVRSF